MSVVMNGRNAYFRFAEREPRGIAILGSTGSIGTQVLRVARRYPDRIRVAALVCGSDASALEKQIAEFRPSFAGISNPGRGSDRLCAEFPETEFCLGNDALAEAAVREDAEVVVVASTGLSALAATLAAIDCGKTVAFASKEILVAAGHIVMRRVHEKGATLLPVDSEHSAIFQCLQGNASNAVSRIILTASGGAFRDLTPEQMKDLRAADALRHPTWKMGPKITVDCATMVNKGLEVIEAKWLFDLPPEKVDCILHRQSVIHSMAEFEDGAVLCQMSEPSMELPIQYALFYPERIDCGLRPLDFAKIRNLTFEEIDENKYPSFRLARECLNRGGFSPLVFNAANEVAVEAFLGDRIRYFDMYKLLDSALQHFDFEFNCELDRVYYIDGEVKAFCRAQVQNYGV